MPATDANGTVVIPAGQVDLERMYSTYKGNVKRGRKAKVTSATSVKSEATRAAEYLKELQVKRETQLKAAANGRALSILKEAYKEVFEGFLTFSLPEVTTEFAAKDVAAWKALTNEDQNKVKAFLTLAKSAS